MPGRPTTLAYGRAGACCACCRCGIGGLFCFFIPSILSFLIPDLLVDGILKYGGLGRYNIAVVVSYY